MYRTAIPIRESHFRTLKYRPDFPDRFGCIEDSRAFCQNFFAWYNEEQRHCGIELLTPSIGLVSNSVNTGLISAQLTLPINQWSCRWLSY
jgi:hypothetical protein